MEPNRAIRCRGFGASCLGFRVIFASHLFRVLGFTLSQLGHARRGSRYEVGVRLETGTPSHQDRVLGFRVLRFTLSQLGQARRGSWYEVGVTQERQAIDRKQAPEPDLRTMNHPEGQWSA